MRWLRGCEDGVHKFEARYEKGTFQLPWDRLKNFKMAHETLVAMIPEKYVRDVCVRCGKVIEREISP